MLAAALLTPLALAAVLAALALESAPRLSASPPPAPQDAARASAVVQAVRAATLTPGVTAVTVTEADAAALIAVARRVAPWMRGAVEIRPEGVTLRLSAAPPVIGRLGWINVAMRAPPSALGLRLDRLRVGALPLPAALARPMAVAALNLGFGGGAGDLAASAVLTLRTSAGEAVLEVALTETQREVLMAHARSAGRGVMFAARPEDVADRQAALSAAMAGGAAGQGGYARLLRLALEQAAEAAEAQGRPRAQIEATLFALAIACGHARFSEIAGTQPRAPGARSCQGARLFGRGDLVQHHALSMGLQAASDAQAAFGLGEVKELYDSARGSGFSFDDLLANRAGVRLAVQLLAGGPEDWRAAAELVEGDADLLPPFDDLPAGLSAAAFKEAYGDVDSAAYAEVVAAIDRRLDALPLYARRTP